LSNSAPHVVTNSIIVNQPVPIPITYKSYAANGVPPSKIAEITSAIRLPSTCFKPVTSSDSNFAQFDSALVKSIHVCDVGLETGLKNEDFTMCELGFRMDHYGSEISVCTEAQVYSQPESNGPVQRLHYARWPNRLDNSRILAKAKERDIYLNGTLPISSVVGDAGVDYAKNNTRVNFTISGVYKAQAERWSREAALFVDGVPNKAWAWARAKVDFVSFRSANVTLRFAKPFFYKITTVCMARICL
jgi:hypothetical protein